MKYAPPRLRRLGSIADLTLGISKNGPPDVMGTGKQGNRPPTN